jgi:hypothetical protein
MVRSKLNAMLLIRNPLEVDNYCLIDFPEKADMGMKTVCGESGLVCSP